MDEADVVISVAILLLAGVGLVSARVLNKDGAAELFYQRRRNHAAVHAIRGSYAVLFIAAAAHARSLLQHAWGRWGRRATRAALGRVRRLSAAGAARRLV